MGGWVVRSEMGARGQGVPQGPWCIQLTVGRRAPPPQINDASLIITPPPCLCPSDLTYSRTPEVQFPGIPFENNTFAGETHDGFTQVGGALGASGLGVAGVQVAWGEGGRG